MFARGDLNRDGVVDALDVSALVQELNDVDTSIFFRPGEEDGNVLLFTLDYDQSRLTFDSSDAGADGIPDGVSNNLAGDFLVFVLHNATRTDGELGFLVVDVLMALQALDDVISGGVSIVP